jgi:hypothetical protein
MSTVRVKVNVEGAEIIVKDAATEWWASYRHSPANNRLVAVQIVTDRAAKVSDRAKFLGQAFGVACAKARWLGWMA